MKKLIIILTLLSTFFIYFEGFIFSLDGNSFIYYYILIYLLLLSIFIVCYRKILIRILKFLYLKTPFKYLIYFIVWLLIDSLILVITGKANILIYYRIFTKLLLPSIFCYFISAIFVPKFVSTKKTIKLLILFMFIFTILGFIGFIGDTYNVGCFSNIINFFSNFKKITSGTESTIDMISGGARARSIFHEPGSYGKYILLFSPILYKICLSKYKIFQNKYLNVFIKYSLIPLSLISIVLTKSPIILLFMLVFLFCYFYKNIIYLFKKNLIFILVSVVTLIMVVKFINYDITNTYLYRIVNTISSFNDFNMLIFVEASLAARIVSYVNTFILFLQKPFLGFGYDNLRYFMTDQFINSPLPLTPENNSALHVAITTGQGCGFNKSLLSALLGETGLVGTFLYFLFLYKNIKYIDNLKSHFNGLEIKFLEGLRITIIMVIILSFYIYSFATSYLYLYYGLVCSYIVQYYINKGVNK